MSGREMPTAYQPLTFEDEMYRFWEEGGYFRAEPAPGAEPFTIVLPPPNVTGRLHIGHALDATMQDILARFWRMRGRPTLWLPGTDHAGLATQIKVEEELREQEGLTRHDLGRERFVERVWAWKHQYGGEITGQIRRLGASCDWSRERFTMDESLSQAVREVFVRLYERGLIYRGDYMVNWCPHCHTALSDIEVEHEETVGKLHYVRYALADGDGYVTVATTRPETILGDTAVAVHPDDERYRALVGRELVLPVVGRRIPIVADPHCDPAFGTGAVKVTPAHDPNDFEIGRRHGLPSLEVVGKDGRMTAAAGESYAGLERYECRRRLLADLEAAGALVEIKDHPMALGGCQRCGTTVEPLVSTQWFVRMEPLAGPALEAVLDGRTRFVPERFVKIYQHWLENIRDWCISRQIWWGHRIPAWYCDNCGHTNVATAAPAACASCGSTDLQQDEDALDTWFSSALWPFSTLGWPERTDDLAYFYPTSVLVTGHDILFFWVARMMFMALAFTDDVPFRDVLMHGLVRDSEGRKMSKSLGNGVDPLAVIEQYGADALRFTLISGTTPGNDTRFHWEKVEASRNFANKLWNASRFVLMNLSDFDTAAAGGAAGAGAGAVAGAGDGAGQLPQAALEDADRWILTRLQDTVVAVTRLLERYELGEASRMIYEFVWDEFCDWYIELVKPRLYAGADDGPAHEAAAGPAAVSRHAAQATLRHVLDQTLRLLHPFMPFVTEAIWQRLPGRGEALVVALWPAEEAGHRFPAAAARLEAAKDIIHQIRNLRAELNVPPGHRAPVLLQAGSPDAHALIVAMAPHIASLGRASELTHWQAGDAGFAVPSAEEAATAVTAGVEIFLPLRGLIDVERETARLGKELAAATTEAEKLRTKLANPGFLAKAPPAVVAKEQGRAAELAQQVETLTARLEALRQL